MRSLGGGAIINLSSNSVQLGLAGYPTYVTAKAGILGLTRALARELGPDNIRVNCLIPGWVMTERQRALWVNEADLGECLDQQCLKEAIPVEDMIGPCLFLASQASRMMTGQELIVDGGRA
jgi:NAD(P)-dependent dehydrogenase (short-subunit alcohol dehydrogenase family)